MFADILAQDAQGRDILVVSVEGMRLSPEILAEIFEAIERESPNIPYSMVVDQHEIYLKKQGCEPRPDTYCVLNLDDVLRHYDSDVGKKRIFHGYRRALVEAWLSDFAYHWKSETPPGAEQVAAIGLQERLVGGTTYREVPLGADAVR